MLGLFNPQIRPFLPDLGYKKQSSNAKAWQMLRWTPHNPHEAIIAAASSMAWMH
jgi:hypothetical protein